MCIVFFPTQDLDKIAEANELFDAVLTGTVDREKETTTKVASSIDGSAKEKEKSADARREKPEKSQRKLSLYIGNFPWVSTTQPQCLNTTW